MAKSVARPREQFYTNLNICMTCVGAFFLKQHLLGAGEHKGFTGLGGQCVLLKVIRAVVQGEHSLGRKEEQEKPDK